MQKLHSAQRAQTSAKASISWTESDAGFESEYPD